MKTKTIVLSSFLFALIVLGTLFHSISSAKKNKSVSRVRSGGAIAASFTQESLKHGKKPNLLIQEKSPYLLRHAFDPVDWNPWGEEAFAKAQKAKKPIFLSIGYASCFACYSMQRDVFEDRKIAERMNEYAINILVDREERPDIDRLYMSVLQTVSGDGGWPMSLFLTPERKPFYAATYVSASLFTATLARVHEVWKLHPQRLSDSGNLIASYLENLARGEPKRALADTRALRKGFAAFRELYDTEFGGFGSAPKFPHPMILSFLLRYFQLTDDKSALEMTLTTLQRMAAGAIFDHVGYGFHRYTADDEWRTPHFEKMIYDQALLTIIYLEAFQITHDPQYSTIARQTLSYVRREMVSANGAFYGAQDAASSRDSTSPEEKVPGFFYTWKCNEIDQILGPVEAPIFRFVFGIRPEGNSLHDPANALANRNVIFTSHTEREAALKFHMNETEIHSNLNRDLSKLFAERYRRPKPQVDDKIILSWNALMISAFAKAYEILGDNAYLQVAERCDRFLDQKLYLLKTKELLRRYREGEARYHANLQDYAFYVQSLLDLYEASFDIRYLQRAITLSDQMTHLFEDKSNGGFFDAAADDKSLPVRTREFHDDSEPSGNAIAVLDLLRLSQITGDRRDREIVDRSLHFFSSHIIDQPETMPQLLVALAFNLQKSEQIIIAGNAEDHLTHQLLNEIHARFLPNTIILLADGNEGQKILSEYLPLLHSIRMIDGKSTAYVCENYTCKLPTSDPVSLAGILESNHNP